MDLWMLRYDKYRYSGIIDESLLVTIFTFLVG